MFQVERNYSFCFQHEEMFCFQLSECVANDTMLPIHWEGGRTATIPTSIELLLSKIFDDKISIHTNV